MNAIYRDITVTREPIIEKIKVTKGTNMIPIVFNITDFPIPTTASATAYIIDGKSAVARKKLCNIVGNKITLEPTSSLFSVGSNEMQVRIVDKTKTLVTFRMPVECEDSTEFGDIAEEQQQTLIQQILASQGSIQTGLNTEVADRKKADETTAQSITKLTQDKMEKVGDASGTSVAFTSVASRTNIATGEKLSILFGKIAKWFSDLKKGAFSDVANNLTATAEGSVLDARQGKVLSEKINELNGKLGVDYDINKEILTNDTFQGKPVYLKIVPITSLPNNTTTAYNTGIQGATNIWIDEGLSYLELSKGNCSLPYVDTSGYFIRAIVNRTSFNIEITDNWNYSQFSAKIALKYTKDGGTVGPPPQPPVEPQPEVPSVNLFDKSKAESGRYEASNGQHVAGSDYMTITLPYKHGDVIRKSKDASWFTTWILLCDSAKNPIISQVNVVPGNDFTNPGWDEWKMPENIYSLEPKYAQAKYIKVGVSIHGTIKDFSQFMVTINNPLPDHYVPPSGSVTVFSGKTMAFVGDSITAGFVQEVGASNYGQRHGYVEMLQAKHPTATIKNYAIGGATMAHYSNEPIKCVLDQIKDVVAQYPNADYVIIEGGVNDTWTTSKIQLGTVTSGMSAVLDEGTFCGALESAFKQAKEKYAGKKIGYITTHKIPSSPNLGQYMDKAKEICQKWGIPYLDMYANSGIDYSNPTVKAEMSYHTSDHPQGDGIHPNEKCYEQMYLPKVESWLKGL